MTTGQVKRLCVTTNGRRRWTKLQSKDYFIYSTSASNSYEVSQEVSEKTMRCETILKTLKHIDQTGIASSGANQAPPEGRKNGAFT